MTMVGVIVVLVTVDVFVTVSGQVVVCNYNNGWSNCCIMTVDLFVIVSGRGLWL